MELHPSGRANQITGGEHCSRTDSCDSKSVVFNDGSGERENKLKNSKGDRQQRAIDVW